MREFLLTYVCDGYGCYSWFETEEEMNDFIEERGDNISVNERLQITGAREIEG